MRIRKIIVTEIAVTLAFGLAVLFWWEVAEPIRSTGWRGSATIKLRSASPRIISPSPSALLVALAGGFLEQDVQPPGARPHSNRSSI
jgi:hypothetical protein